MSAHDIARVRSECSASPAAAAAADSVSVSFAVAGARLDAGSFRRLALRFTPCFATSAASGVRVAALASAVPALTFAAGGFFLCERVFAGAAAAAAAVAGSSVAGGAVAKRRHALAAALVVPNTNDTG